MSFGERVAQTETYTSNSHVFEIVIKTNNLVPMGTRLCDLETDQSVFIKNNEFCSPLELLNLLYTIQYIVFNSYLGLPKKKNEVKTHCFTHGAVAKERISQYVEFFQNGNHVEAIKFIFVVLDPVFLFEIALSRYWTEIAPNEKQMDGAIFEMIKSQFDWLTDGLSPYMGNEKFNNTKRGFLAFSTPLNTSGNPGQIHRNLNSKRSAEILGLVPINENNEDDEEEDEDDSEEMMPSNMMHFPNGAYRVPHKCRDPNILFKMNIMTLPVEFETEKKRNLALRNSLKLLARPALSNNMTAMADIRNHFLKTTAYIKLQPNHVELMHAFRTSKESMRCLQGFIYNDTTNNGGMVAAKYLYDRWKINPEFSTVDKDYKHRQADPTLSFLGNEMARLFYSLEIIWGCVSVHPQIVMILLTTLALFDIYHKNDMRQHFFLGGPPGAGKSYVMWVVQQLSLTAKLQGAEKSIIEVSSVPTLNSLTTMVPRNGVIIYYDEAPDIFTGKGKDGAGHNMVKEMMTRNVLRAENCWMSKDGKRQKIETEAEQYSTIVALTNVVRNQFAPGIIDRGHYEFVPSQNRHDVDPVYETNRLRHDQDRNAKMNAMADEFKMIQCIVALLSVMIRAEQIPDVDMDLVNAISMKTFVYLQFNKGCFVDKRDKMRIMMKTKDIIMYEAVSYVFFSGQVVKPGEPFAMEQLILCIPYLTGTREHFYFALSLMNQAVRNPFFQVVMKAILKLAMKTEANKRFASSYSAELTEVNGKQQEVGIVIDYNYFCLSVTDEPLIENVCAKIAAKLALIIVSESGMSIDNGTITTMLKDLSVYPFKCESYTGENTKNTVQTEFQVAKTEKKHGGFCMNILRQYVEFYGNEENDIIEDAIKHTFDKSMAGKRIVTGQTLGIKKAIVTTTDNFPFLLKTITPSHNLPSSIEINCDNNLRYMENYFFKGEENKEGTFRTEHIFGSIEEVYLNKWYKKACCKPKDPPAFINTSGTSYPGDFKAGYQREFRPKKPLIDEEEDDVVVVAKEYANMDIDTNEEGPEFVYFNTE